MPTCISPADHAAAVQQAARAIGGSASSWPSFPGEGFVAAAAEFYGFEPGEAAAGEFEEECLCFGAVQEKEVREWLVRRGMVRAGKVAATGAELELGVKDLVPRPILLFLFAALDVLVEFGGEVSGFFLGDRVPERIGQAVLDQQAGEVGIFGADMPEDFGEGAFFGGVFGTGELAAAGAVFELGAVLADAAFVFEFFGAQAGVFLDGELDGRRREVAGIARDDDGVFRGAAFAGGDVDDDLGDGCAGVFRI